MCQREDRLYFERDSWKNWIFIENSVAFLKKRGTVMKRDLLEGHVEIRKLEISTQSQHHRKTGTGIELGFSD